MKKGKEIIIKVNDLNSFNKYMDPLLTKIVVMNVYDKFWGGVEILDSWVRRFLDEDDNEKKVIFIAAEKELGLELWGKQEFNSKPLFYILNKGNIVDIVEGIDIPKLTERLESAFKLL
jgi:hypothetical protein